ncbi:Rac prophage; predicted protein [Escherichia coli]|nr:Rac prophage; predicted protein [Escherichia coli]
MVHYEVVQYLMDCCGITYNQAVQALRSNDWISGRQKSLYVATRCEIRKMQKIDLGNNESLVCGVFPNQDGTFTAMTYTKSKTFKTETGARRWLEKHTVS